MRTSHRLTRGLLLTFVAVGLLALGAAPAWWPSDAAEGAAGSVAVQAQDQSVCGQLAEASPGTVRVVTAERPLEVPIAAVTAIRSVDSC